MSIGLEPTTAPNGAWFALWARDWHKINPGASHTACGRQLPYAKAVDFSIHKPNGLWYCRKCFKPWER